MAIRPARDFQEAGRGQGDDMFELDSAIGDHEHRLRGGPGGRRLCRGLPSPLAEGYAVTSPHDLYAYR